MFLAAAFVAGVVLGYALARLRGARTLSGAPADLSGAPTSSSALVPDAGEAAGAPHADEDVGAPHAGAPLKTATILVCDIRSADEEPRTEVLRFLDDLQRVLAGIVADEQGRVDRFAGDRTIAIFSGRDHAAAAIEAGRRMISNVEALARRIGLDISIAVGIHTGAVAIGETASGDAIDTASRVQALTRESGVPLLATEETAKRARGALETAGDGVFTLKEYIRAVQLDLFEELVSP